jgi:hypothetical protein
MADPAAYALAVPEELIERRIYLIRSHKVMLDADLADLYEVPTKGLNQAVRRNLDRFRDDFMFQLAPEEAEILRSQFVTSSWGGRRYLPYAFTEHGVAMLSSVLSSKRAVQMNILIVRAFIKLRAVLATHIELATKLKEIEQTQLGHAANIDEIWRALQSLVEPPVTPKRQIGFNANAPAELRAHRLKATAI